MNSWNLRSPRPRRSGWRLTVSASIALWATALSAFSADSADSLRVLDSGRHHLGLPGEPEWQDLAGAPPEGRMLQIQFSAELNSAPATLLIRQQDVKLKWPILLNGRKLGFLEINEQPLVLAVTVPAGILHSGENTLSILSPEAVDDIVISEVKLDRRPLEAALHEAAVHVSVTGEDGAPIPCRLTIVDAQGCLAPLHADPNQQLAARTGVIYTGDGEARFGLPAGTYSIYANRGFEYGVDERKCTLAAGAKEEIALKLLREVPTPGLVSCDTHIHSLTYSGHGDATADERALTLAGEGIELAIATDHNRLVDYSEAARRMKVERYFTCVIGDEVTTKVGHFTAFPFSTTSVNPPDFTGMDWPTLVQGIRSAPGVQVVILNHPRDIHNDFIPFAEPNFNPVTGENRKDPSFGIDGVEVANSGTLQSDFMRSYLDWFALLNRGYRVFSVGSSDSHDVSRFIVGQGRTYIACADTAPGEIDAAAACRNLKAGHASVSLGLLTNLTVNGKFKPGDLAVGLDREISVEAEVLGPSWVQADTVQLFANGIKIREQKIEKTPGVKKATLQWILPKPAHDIYLVAIASGPGVTAPYWPIPAPYQPTGGIRHPRVIGSTNPIWLDADGDRRFKSAHEYAVELVANLHDDPQKLISALAAYDEPTAAQAAALYHSSGGDLHSPVTTAALRSAPAQVREGFAAFTATLPPQ